MRLAAAGMFPAPPPEFNTCLGDLYSVAFLENRCVLHHSLAACSRSRGLLLPLLPLEGG